MRSLLYIGVTLIVIGMLWSTVNYVFHMPDYRPKWFDMHTMMRLIELNLVFTAVGVLIIIYESSRTVAKQ